MDDLLQKLKYYLGIAIPILYIIMGIYVMIEKIFIVKIEPVYAYAFGVVLILYGIFRIFRVYKYLSNK